MRWSLGCGVGWLLAVAVVGCDSPAAGLDAGHHYDAGLGGGGGGEENCGPMSQYPDCSVTCGNGHVETCRRISMLSTHCHVWIDMQELCDGDGPQLCAALGYYAGTATCAACFSFDDSGCDACAAGSLACTSTEFQRGAGFAVSGTEIAQRGANGDIQLFDAAGAPIVLVPTASTSITATSTGWLISSAQGIQALSYAGVLGAAQPALGDGATVAPGPTAGHYLELWRQGALRPVRAILHDATGATIGTAFDTFMFDSGGELAATSDGAHAFLGLDGKLAVVADDGSVAISASAFPSIPNGHAFLTSVSSRWYIGADLADWSAQRFDGTGAPVGLAIHIAAPASGFLGDGDELLAVHETNTGLHAGPVVLVRYTTDGTAAATSTIGVGRAPYMPAALDHLGGDIVVSWSGPQGTNLARVAAP